MMSYNISKYTPDKWDETGDCWDWIAIGDIGRAFNGEILTLEEYKRVEDNYIKALYYVLDYLKIERVWVKDVAISGDDKKFLDKRKNHMELYGKEIMEWFYEVHKGHMELYDEKLMKMYKNVESIKRLDYEDIGDFCRLQLREDIGAKVFYPRRLGIYICYDFLLGIHSSHAIDEIIPKINELGLIVKGKKIRKWWRRWWRN